MGISRSPIKREMMSDKAFNECVSLLSPDFYLPSLKKLIAWTVNPSRPSPSGAPLRFAALTDSLYPARPEGADGERTPTFYLGLKNF